MRPTSLPLILRLALVLLSFLALIGPSDARAQDASGNGALRRPNIVLFLADDLGWRDLSCYGSEFYQTPNIDAFAARSMKFEQAYAAHPRCVPSRYAIFTGRYAARTGRRMGGNMKLERVTIAEALKAQGYQTFFVGKWHLGKEGAYPEDQGFDVNIAGYHGGATESHFAPFGAEKGRPGELIPGLEDAPEGEYLTDRLTTEAIGCLDGASPDAPFFLALCHYAVHTPIEAKADKTARFAARLAEMPPFEQPEYEDEGTGVTKLRQDGPEYAAMIESLDESFGRMMAALEERGLLENTIVVFTSDHGGLSNRGNNNRRLATSNMPLRAGKGWLYEGGVRVPLMAYWPGVTEAPTTTGAVVTGTDLYPTFLEMAGMPPRPDEALDGVSFAGTIRGAAQDRGAIFWHSPNARPGSTGDTNSSAVRRGDYKLIEWWEEGRVELYDLASDPGERHDLSGSRPELRDELLALLHAWREDTGAWTRD